MSLGDAPTVLGQLGLCNLSLFIFYVVLPIGFNTSQLVVDEGVGMVTVCVVTGSEFRNQVSLELFAEVESTNTNATGVCVRTYVCVCTCVLVRMYVCMCVCLWCVCVCLWYSMCLCACLFDLCGACTVCTVQYVCV